MFYEDKRKLEVFAIIKKAREELKEAEEQATKANRELQRKKDAYDKTFMKFESYLDGIDCI